MVGKGVCARAHVCMCVRKEVEGVYGEGGVDVRVLLLLLFVSVHRICVCVVGGEGDVGCGVCACVHSCVRTCVSVCVRRVR